MSFIRDKSFHLCMVIGLQYFHLFNSLFGLGLPHNKGAEVECDVLHLMSLSCWIAGEMRHLFFSKTLNQAYFSILPIIDYYSQLIRFWTKQNLRCFTAWFFVFQDNKLIDFWHFLGGNAPRTKGVVSNYSYPKNILKNNHAR